MSEPTTPNPVINPCPFCESGNLKAREDNDYFWRDGNPEHWIICEDCGAHGPVKETFNQALDAWNSKGNES